MGRLLGPHERELELLRIYSINEDGRFTQPSQTGKTADELRNEWAEHDENLFHTSRHITCGLYANIALRDYARTILDVQRLPSSWSLDPRKNNGDNLFETHLPEGNGNRVSVEFNLIYRWHSILSKRDEEWTAAQLRQMLQGADPSTMTGDDFIKTLRQVEANMPRSGSDRRFGNMPRGSDGLYPDDSLLNIFFRSVEDIAGSFGAKGVPDALRPVEILGIQQARRWEVGSLNDYRESAGLQRHCTFADINCDPTVVQALSKLYKSPDEVELYPGAVIEQSNEVGLCANLTTSFTILSDAMALIRGDRLLTKDFIPERLTCWG